MNIYGLLGFVCGIVVSALLVWALLRRFNTDGKTKTQYDERQKVARGVGFMYAFYVLAAWIVVLIAIDMMEVTLPITDTVLYFTGIVVSGLVLSWYCIMHDAYWGMNSNVKFYTRFLIAIGALNIIAGIGEIVNGNMFEDGVLSNLFINFEAGILIAGIGVFLLIKKRRDGIESAEDVDEESVELADGGSIESGAEEGATEIDSEI